MWRAYTMTAFRAVQDCTAVLHGLACGVSWAADPQHAAAVWELCDLVFVWQAAVCGVQCALGLSVVMSVADAQCDRTMLASVLSWARTLNQTLTAALQHTFKDELSDQLRAPAA